MKLCSFTHNGTPRIGAQDDRGVLDLSAAHVALAPGAPALPAQIIDVIRGGEATRRAVRAAFDHARTAGDKFLVNARLLAPLPRPGKVLCSGINYYGHLKENPNAKLPEEPFFFAKLPNAVVGPGDPIVIPPRSQQVDYEVELAVVIGKTLTRATPDEIPAGIFGYTILHDVSARDVQFKDSQITLGKNFDSFCPIGPCVVTADAFSPERKKLRTIVNGTILQDGTTEDWVFPLPKLLSFLSHVVTLEPGDVISTGTPMGVGYFRSPQVFLRAGDVVTLEIEGIGHLQNPVVAR